MNSTVSETDFGAIDPTAGVRPAHRWLLRLLVLAAAFAFVFSSLSTGFISGSSDYWQRLSGDPATAQVGWLYYAHDAWRWPLFDVRNYHYPEFSNIYLSDSLPLFALPAKLVYTISGRLLTYTGLWVALCFFLQAVCASRLLSALRVRALLPHFAGIVLLCYMPALFQRFGHMSLMAHFFVLAELTFYVRGKHESLGRGDWFWVCALPVIAILTHPYMAAMTLLLSLVVIADRWRDGVLSLRGVLARLSALALASVTVVVCSGFIFPQAKFATSEYGIYSTNLLSPFVPFGGTWLGLRLGTETPTIPGIYQWEGGAYLGMGVLFLIVCCLPYWQTARAVVRRNMVLFAALALTAAFAVSHRIGFGAHELTHLPMPDWLVQKLSAFRSGGRFIWLTMYSCIAAAIACVATRYRPRTAAALLAIAALLQWVDVRPMQAARYDVSATAPAPTINEARWHDLIAAHERIFQFPSFECGGIFNEDIEHATRFHELDIALIAARLNKPTNSAYLARYTKDCAREREDAAEMAQPGTLYLYRSSEDIGALMAAYGQDTSRCISLDNVVVCSSTVDLSKG